MSNLVAIHLPGLVVLAYLCKIMYQDFSFSQCVVLNKASTGFTLITMQDYDRFNIPRFAIVHPSKKDTNSHV